MAVFVTDGEQRSALAVVRSLGRAGIRVTVGSSRPASLAGSSRYCARTVCYPSPRDASTQFQEFLREEMASGRYRLLLPMTDIAARIVARQRDLLSPWVCLPLPAEDRLLLAQDKRCALMLAERVSISHPETYMTNPEERIEDVARLARYPVVIKPRFSKFPHGAGWFSGEVEYARDARELMEKYRRSHARIPFPLVQEKIQGEGQGVFLLLWNGELKAAFCHRRLREKPPWGGPSVFRESIPLDPALLQKCVAFLQTIGWQGPAMLEFKVDTRDGQPKLMEVNGRFWGSLQLAIDAGMDFPLLLYRLATGEDVAPQFSYRIGVKSRWLLGDLDHLLIRLKNAPAPDGSNGHSTSRLRACLNFLKPYERDSYSEIFRRNDPRPAWQEWREYWRALTSRSASTEGKRRAS
ncbi:MAG TPA: ATP-grasp domain-containing protein [Patescibacteria group bacterium]|nr:ATP-grasp domain-containing protein [Patescibacteria group bacterium]